MTVTPDTSYHLSAWDASVGAAQMNKLSVTVDTISMPRTFTCTMAKNMSHLTIDLNGGTLHSQSSNIEYNEEAGTVITIPKPSRTD